MPSSKDEIYEAIKKLKEELLIPAGEFMMGSPKSEKGRYDDEVRHKVILANPFYMLKTPVTQAQFEEVMGYNPSFFQGEDRPVERVNWHEAAAFCNALSREFALSECYDLTGSGKDVEAKIKPEYEGQNYYNCKGYRLPTEAEWEYAYRAGTTTAFYNGDIISEYGKDLNLDKIGWYWENSGRKTHPVAQKKNNAWGLYDMAGNVWEWVYDWEKNNIDEQYLDQTHFLYQFPSERRLCGGSWDEIPRNCRAAFHSSDDPFERSDNLGFRVVRSV